MKLKALRLKEGKTQQEVANALHCTAMSYSRYERGKREPDIATLWRIADYFDVTLDDLLGREYSKANIPLQCTEE